jgi:CheY-like chemotaxis protein
MAAPGSRPRAWLTPGKSHLAGRLLLVVDDNTTNRRILNGVATGWGMIVRCAKSSQEALEWLRAGELFDVAVLDMHMPQMDGEKLAAAIRQLRQADQLPLVLLSSLGAREEVGDASLFESFLTKPAKPNQLFDTLCGVLKHELAAEVTSTAHAFVASAPKPVGATRPERVLLAEDNVINQKVALLMLGKLGYRADVAADGNEVIEAVQRQRYDVVLMDVQMPNMDGPAATRAIRAAEAARGCPRTPIIALTANVMSHQIADYIAAGMDSFVAKPRQAGALFEALRAVADGREDDSVPRSAAG